jgi:AraC family transcriptional regulator
MNQTVRRSGAGQFYGDLLMSERIADVICSETFQAPGLELPLHRHDRAFLELALEGRWTETVGREHRVLQPNAFVYHPPGECHANRLSSSGGRAFYVELSPRWVVRLGEFRLGPDAPLFCPNGGVGEPLRRLHAELRHRDEWSALAVEGLLYETFAAIGRWRATPAQSPAPPWLRRAVEELRESSPPPRSLQELARSLDIHPSVLSRTFRKYLGCTPSEYLRRVRVEQARSLMATSDEPLSIIGLRVGFVDQSHFTRVFRRLTGQTPNQARRQAQATSRTGIPRRTH